jgi:hypothetical protein
VLRRSVTHAAGPLGRLSWYSNWVEWDLSERLKAGPMEVSGGTIHLDV